MDDLPHDARRIPMVQRMELPIGEQIDIPNEFLLQQMAARSDYGCNSFPNTRRIHAFPPRCPPNRATLACGGAHDHPNCRVDSGSGRSPQVFLPQKNGPQGCSGCESVDFIPRKMKKSGARRRPTLVLPYSGAMCTRRARAGQAPRETYFRSFTLDTS